MYASYCTSNLKSQPVCSCICPLPLFETEKVRAKQATRKRPRRGRISSYINKLKFKIVSIGVMSNPQALQALEEKISFDERFVIKSNDVLLFFQKIDGKSGYVQVVSFL